MLPTSLTSDPRAYALFVAALIALVAWQRTLSWREYAPLHRLKTTVLPILDRLKRHPAVPIPAGLLLISRKGYREHDAEFLTTDADSVRAVWQRLVAGGASPHLINSVKRRPTPDGGTQLSAAHVVWLHADGTQTEAYLFAAVESGGTDIYAHHEPSVTDPEAHLSGAQRNGDPRGVVRAALDRDA